MDSKHRAVPTTLVRGRLASGLTRPITEWRPGSPLTLLVAGSWPGSLVSSLGLSISSNWLRMLTRARPGGAHMCPPHGFFADSRKMAARSAAKFGIAVHSSFAHLV